MVVKILQVNLGRAWVAHDLAWAEALKMRADIMVVSEPNKKIGTDKGWLMDERKDVAISVCNGGVKMEVKKKGSGYIHVRLYDIDLFAVYLSPNISINEYKRRMDEIFGEVEKRRYTSILAGDINAKSAIWGSQSADERGSHVEDWMTQLQFEAKNDGEHTFERGTSRSHIDVTLCSNRLSNRITGWTVAHTNPYTHYGSIHYQIKLREKIRRNEIRSVFFERDTFAKELRKRCEETTNDIYQNILRAFKTSTSKERENRRDRPYWWTEEIEKARKRYILLRRQYTRQNRSETEKLELNRRMNEQRKVLKREIRISKRRRWEGVIADLDGDIWGEGYRIVTGALMKGRGVYRIPVKRRKKILQELFPRTTRLEQYNIRTENSSYEPWTARDLEEALKHVRSGKAPGPDGLTV